MNQVLITTPNFGARSGAPWKALEECGLTARVVVDRHPLSSSELAAESQGADALIVGLDRVDAAVLDANPGLRVVAKHGVGVDNIDVAAAAERGVVVTNAPGLSTGAVAELTIGLLLGVARHLQAAHRSTAQGEWQRFYGPELAGRTIAIIGYGRIGRAVASRAAALGMKVIAHDPYLTERELDGVPLLALDVCLSTADVISLHLPGGSGSPLLGAAELASMRTGSYLVNTARGDLVDEAALAEALRSGHLAGAGIDAFATEPPVGSPLLSAPNVVLSPHVGANSDDANAALGTTVVRDIARVLAGESPLNPVTAPSGQPGQLLDNTHPATQEVR